MTSPSQLVSYIAPGAPATRRRASGAEPHLRPEIGFTPKWYRDALGIDFGERWHTDPKHRLNCVRQMRDEIRRRFPNTDIGGLRDPHAPIDILTGTYGACTIAGIYGLPILYHDDNWPIAAQQYLSDAEMAAITPPDLDTNPFFQSLMQQVDWIGDAMGVITGFVNWQGVLNNAHRLRGESLFIDMLTEPEACQRLFDCVCTTMIDATQRLHTVQWASGFPVSFCTVSNCLVNMVSPEIYREQLLPFDKRLAEAFGCIGVHNCAWTVDGYLDAYADIPHLGYIDMGLESNLPEARNSTSSARRAVMYRPTELADKSDEVLRGDLERIAIELGPCDVVFADIESGTPDERVINVVQWCDEIGKRTASAVGSGR